MDAKHSGLLVLRRALLLAGAALACGVALVLVSSASAHAAEDDTDGTGLLGLVSAATATVSATVEQVDSGLSEVVQETAAVVAPVSEVVHAAVPAPVAAPAAPAVSAVTEVSESVVESVEFAAGSAVGAVESVAASEPIDAVADAVLVAVGDAPLGGSVLDRVVATEPGHALVGAASAIDHLLVSVIGNSAGPAVTLPDVPTGILDQVVAIITPDSHAPGPVPDARPDPAVGAAQPAGTGSLIPGVPDSIPAPGSVEQTAHPRLPATTTTAARASDPGPVPSSAPPGGPLTPGSCSLTGASGGAHGGAALHAALNAAAVPLLRDGGAASVSSDAVPPAPTYPTDVSPD